MKTLVSCFRQSLIAFCAIRTVNFRCFVCSTSNTKQQQQRQHVNVRYVCVCILSAYLKSNKNTPFCSVQQTYVRAFKYAWRLGTVARREIQQFWFCVFKRCCVFCGSFALSLQQAVRDQARLCTRRHKASCMRRQRRLRRPTVPSRDCPRATSSTCRKHPPCRP